MRSIYPSLAAILLQPLASHAQSISTAPETSKDIATAVRSKPVTEPSTWVAKDDYPAAAKRAGQEGSVGFALVVGIEGRPTDCTVTESSGSESLDAASCKALLRRARFNPAIGKRRAPMTDRWVGVISWKLAADQMPPPANVYCNDCNIPWTTMSDTIIAPSPLGNPARWITPNDYSAKLLSRGVGVTVELRVGLDGSIGSCKASVSSGSAQLDRRVCALLRQRARFKPWRKTDALWTTYNWEHRYAL